jgi:hypothetical protein
VVWIDWRGTDPRTWVFVDGHNAHSAAVSDSVVLANDASLSLVSSRVLIDRDLGELFGKIRPLRGILPAVLNAYHESKWTSIGVLATPGCPPLTGTAIHEVVRFA